MRIPYVLEKYLYKKFSLMNAFIESKILDEHGKIISSKEQICHSFTENFLSWLQTALHGHDGNSSYGFYAPHTNNNSIFRNTGVEWASFESFFNCSALAGDGTQGLVVGTGNIAPVPLTRTLTSQIAPGAAAGQLTHQAQSSLGVSVLGNVTSWTINRVFINNSGGSISVGEVALIGGGSGVYGSVYYLHLMDIFTPIKIVNNLQTLALGLTIQTTT